MIVGARVTERLQAMGLSQSELARRVGVSQPTVANLIHRSKKGSAYLHKFARELGTSAAYLSGETDDPSPDALPPTPPPPVRIMMEVQLPGEDVLTMMFTALLRGIDKSLPEGEQARLLARRLPIGLSQVQDVRPARSPAAIVPSHQEVDASHARRHLEPQR